MLHNLLNLHCKTEHIMEFVNTKKIMGRANAKYGTK